MHTVRTLTLIVGGGIGRIYLHFSCLHRWYWACMGSSNYTNSLRTDNTATRKLDKTKPCAKCRIYGYCYIIIISSSSIVVIITIITIVLLFFCFLVFQNILRYW